MGGLEITGAGGGVASGLRGFSETVSLLFFRGLFGGLPPEDLSKIFRGSLLGFLRRCTRISAS